MFAYILLKVSFHCSYIILQMYMHIRHYHSSHWYRFFGIRLMTCIYSLHVFGIENLFHFTVLFQRTSKHEYHFKEFGNGFDNERKFQLKMIRYGQLSDI